MAALRLAALGGADECVRPYIRRYGGDRWVKIRIKIEGGAREGARFA